MVCIELNGSTKECQASNLADILIEVGFDETVVATAVNGDFVAQSRRKETCINNGDRVEVVAPMQGG